MLKHSLYEPEAPYVIYNVENPPYVPNVHVHPSVQHLLPLISGLVANKLTMGMRMNTTRMYLYNECSANFWQNQNFAEVVKFVADVLALLIKDMTSTPFPELLERAVIEGLTLINSRKVFEIPEIRSTVDPVQMNMVNINIDLYRRKVVEIDRYYDSIDPRPKINNEIPKRPVQLINPNEIYQQPYQEPNMNIPRQPDVYNINPRNSPGYNQPPPQQYQQPQHSQHSQHSQQPPSQPQTNQYPPGYIPQPGIQTMGYPAPMQTGTQPGFVPGMQQQYPNQQMLQQMYPNQQMLQQMYHNQQMLQQMYPNQQMLQPDMQQQYPNQQMLQQMYHNQQMMAGGYPNQQMLQPGMTPGLTQMYPTQQQQMFNPNQGYQGPQHLMQPGMQSGFGRTYLAPNAIPNYPQGFIPYPTQANNFNAPQNGQTRTFQPANYNHTPAANTHGLTGNLSGSRFTSPVDQSSFFNPDNQPNRPRPPGTEHANPIYCEQKQDNRFVYAPAPEDNPPIVSAVDMEDFDFNSVETKPVAKQPNPSVFISDAEVPNLVTKKEWRPSSSQPYLKMIDPLSQREEFRRTGDKVVQLVFDLENPVKRDQHTIKMLGDTYKLDGVISNKRMERLEASMNNMLKISGVDVGNCEEKPDEKVTAERYPEIEVKHYIDPERIIDYFLDQAMFEASLRYKEYNLNHKEHKSNVYRCFLAINKPVITDEDYHIYVDSLRQTKSFAELSTRLKAMGTTINDKEEGINGLSVIGFLLNVDRTLTGMVNSFLRHELTLPEINIDSFAGDVNDLPNFLENKYSKKYKDAFVEWERNIMQRLFVYHDNRDNLYDRLLDDKQKDLGIKVTFIPETYSATFISSTYDELNLNFDKKETLLLDGRKQKVLYKAAQSIYYQKEGGARDSVVDYVITSDNVRLRVYRGYLNNEAYLVSKA
jgi:hypothetical protein